MEEITYPCNDLKMFYNFEKHRYILTLTGAKEYKDPILIYGSEAIANAKLNRLSMQVYSWIKGVVSISNYAYVEYQLAKNPKFRNDIYEMLLNQYIYAVDSSGDKLAHQSGVNTNNAKVIALDDLNERTIDSITMEIFFNTGLGYAGRMRYAISDYHVGY